MWITSQFPAIWIFRSTRASSTGDSTFKKSQKSKHWFVVLGGSDLPPSYCESMKHIDLRLAFSQPEQQVLNMLAFPRGIHSQLRSPFGGKDSQWPSATVWASQCIEATYWTDTNDLSRDVPGWTLWPHLHHTIDVPNSHWLVDEKGGGWRFTPWTTGKYLMIDGINQLPAPTYSYQKDITLR